MSIEFFQRKKQAIDGVIAAYEALQRALEELPPEWRKELPFDLPSQGQSGPPLPLRPAEVIQEKESPGPSDAVRDLLSQHPEGLRISRIVKLLRGKVKTKSKNEYKLLYSTVGTLQRLGHVTLGDDGLYRLATQP